MKDLDKRLNEIQAELTELRKMVEPKKQGSFVSDSAKADEIHDALKYLHLLPEGYCFCDEADADRWIKVEMMPGRGEQYDLGIVLEICPKLGRQFYRPVCQVKPGKHPKSNERTSRMFNSAIDSPQVRADYSHLLPDGYEFCKESESEQWVKVECPGWNEPQSQIGTIMPNKEVDSFNFKLKSLYRPIRKTQPKPNPYQVDWSSAPEWADVHCWDGNGNGFWWGTVLSYTGWRTKVSFSYFTLPSGLDWKQSKTRKAI